MKDLCYDALATSDRRTLRKTYHARHDGNYEHRRLSDMTIARGPGAWRSWFMSHLIQLESLPMLGQTGLGCMPGYVKTYAKVYHLGPLKIYFGPRRDREPSGECCAASD